MPAAANEPWRTSLIRGLLATLLCGTVVTLAGPASGQDLPRLFENAAVALQAAQSLDEVKMIAGDAHGSAWLAIRRQTMLDFALALSYAWMLAVLARRLQGRSGRASSLFARLVLCCGLLAAVFDCLENVAILHSIADPLKWVPSLSVLAKLKWGALGLATLGVTRYCWPVMPIDTETKAFGAFAAFLYANAGALSLAGIIWPLAWERFGLPFAGALLVSLGLTIKKS